MLIVPVDAPAGMLPFFRSLLDAIAELQLPTKPQRLGRVLLKTDLPDAALWPECAILCDEINSVVVSTLVTGSYAWKRADGSAL